MARADRFLKACRREQVDCTPVWMMRQAGRYMKEYRDIRAKHSFLEMCKNPELASKITLLPVHRFEIDAAIIFADILLPLEPMGMELNYSKGEGPVISNPVRNLRDVEKLQPVESSTQLQFLMDAIRITLKELDRQVPLIGFSGAPFTLASYIIEGGGSRYYEHTKALMYNEPLAWHKFMEYLSEVVINYLQAQISAGVHAVQIFDSWVGCMSVSDYKEFVFPHQKKLLDRLKKTVPVIHFAFNAGHLIELVSEAGGNVIGVDWRINIDQAWKRAGYQRAIQGNLDPVTLFGPVDFIEKRVKQILDMVAGRNGHIMNLGHGILPTTPVEHAEAFVNAVHQLSRR
ncbi:MAG: uroporphyrinogen decarboxylase [Candidatus Tectomicrobia bacterium]|uniref:Uroporphyrinogen decarboxylase n=1 Tax=Tectimicrobiota bacterium TaxID=2528274 RepID=A0A933LPM4_UNCTE|nr:uroporphyrinogen decarboxylase [Candidatus Tectomicrobia bacterium]